MTATVAHGALAEEPQPSLPTVQQFLNSCSMSDATSQRKCDKPIRVNIISMAVVPALKAQVCLPSDNNFSALRTSIVEWLSARPEFATEVDWKGAWIAMKTLYPCK